MLRVLELVMWGWRVIQILDTTPGHVSASLHRQRSTLHQLQARMTREQWLRSFRMQLVDVQDLFAKIADALHRNPVKAINSSGSPILPECRLLMGIRWCAGASYLDLMTIFGVSKAAFFASLWGLFEALVNLIPIVFHMDRASCVARARDFILRQRKPIFRHVIGAVDGILVACRCPSVDEYPKPAQFWTRKGFYALNVQAVCDARRVFVFLAVDCPGACHDSVAFSMSKLGQNLFRIPQPYYILGDAAYKAFDRILVPYEGRGRTEDEKNFNYFQSSLRMNIECSFGLLVARWGALWRPLRSTLARNVLTVRAIATLHNWCQLRRAVPVTAPGGGARGMSLDARPYVNPDGIPEDMLAGSRGPPGIRAEPAMNAVRRVLARDIEQHGLVRPDTSVARAFERADEDGEN
jgi:hypothetical protein